MRKSQMNLLGQKVGAGQMKKILGGYGLVPLPYNWSCTSGPEYWCGFDQAQCVANCPTGVCKKILNCL